MQLFLHISQEAKIKSDLKKIEELVTPESSLMDQNVAILESLSFLQQENEFNIFANNKAQTA